MCMYVCLCVCVCVCFILPRITYVHTFKLTMITRIHTQVPSLLAHEYLSRQSLLELFLILYYIYITHQKPKPHTCRYRRSWHTDTYPDNPFSSYSSHPLASPLTTDPHSEQRLHTPNCQRLTFYACFRTVQRWPTPRNSCARYTGTASLRTPMRARLAYNIIIIIIRGRRSYACLCRHRLNLTNALIW
jgi:hypothetical protein